MNCRSTTRSFLAVQTYHRHQVPPTRDYYVWDQFRGPDGRPLYPQRPVLQGPRFAKSTTGAIQIGRFAGKMIVIETLLDWDALPWQADWYRSKVKEALGARLDDNFRLWYIDHAAHGGPPPGPANTHLVSYTGALHQALLDVSAWVEKGVAPPVSTQYKIVDGQVEVPAKAGERKGIQPVVVVTADDAARTEVEVGTPVEFVADHRSSARDRQDSCRRVGLRGRWSLRACRSAQSRQSCRNSNDRKN